MYARQTRNGSKKQLEINTETEREVADDMYKIRKNQG